MHSKRIGSVFFIALLLIGGGSLLFVLKSGPEKTGSGPVVAAPQADAVEATAVDVSAVASGIKDVLANYRKIIVLLADEKKLSAAEREQANRVGQELFHANQDSLQCLPRRSTNSWRLPTRGGLPQSTDCSITSNRTRRLFDADRLAFRELLQSMLAAVAGIVPSRHQGAQAHLGRPGCTDRDRAQL